MAGSESRTVVTVEELIEQDMLAEIRIGLEFFRVAKHRAASFFVFQENTRKPTRYLLRNFPQIHHNAGTSRTLDLQIVAVIMMEFLQRFDQKVVDGKPNRPSPVRIAAEKAACRLGWFVIDAIFLAIDFEDVRRIFMKLRHGSNAVRRKKFILVEHDLQNAFEAITIGNGEEQTFALSGRSRTIDLVGQLGAIVDEPTHTALKIRQLTQHIRFDRRDRK